MTFDINERLYCGKASSFYIKKQFLNKIVQMFRLIVARFLLWLSFKIFFSSFDCDFFSLKVLLRRFVDSSPKFFSPFKRSIVPEIIRFIVQHFFKGAILKLRKFLF